MAQNFTTDWAEMCNMLDFSKSEKNRTYVMYIFGHISVKQRHLPDQQVDSGPCIVQLCENDSRLNPHSGWHITLSHVRSIWWASTRTTFNLLNEMVVTTLKKVVNL